LQCDGGSRPRPPAPPADSLFDGGGCFSAEI
jgi:hypothetical protein